MLGTAHGPFRGAHGPRLGDAPPPNSQASELARPGPLPADLTWHQEEAAQPARHARRPGHGPVRQPRGRRRPSRNLRRATRPLPSGSLLRQPRREPGPRGRPQAKCTKKPSWVTVSSLPPSLLLFLSPPVLFPSVSLPWWAGAETLSFYVAQRLALNSKQSSCLSFTAAKQLFFFGSLSVPCFPPGKHHFSKVSFPKQKLNQAELGTF